MLPLVKYQTASWHTFPLIKYKLVATLQIRILDAFLIITYFLLRSTVCFQLAFHLILLLPEMINVKIKHVCQLQVLDMFKEKLQDNKC